MTDTQTTAVEAPKTEDDLLKDVLAMAPFLEQVPTQLMLEDLKTNKDSPEQARLLGFLAAVFVSMAVSQKRIADYLEAVSRPHLTKANPDTPSAKVI